MLPLVNQLGIKINPRVHALSASHEKKPRGRHSNSRATAVCTYRQGIRRIESNRAKKSREADGPVAQWQLPRAPAPHLGVETLCVCAGVCACVVVCVSLGMMRYETSQTVSSALSPVSMATQKSYMTP